MNKPLQQILSELYAIDPKLREHEDKLIILITRLLETKPDTKLDKRFVKQLRSELLGDTRALHSFNFNPMKHLGFALGGIALATLLIIPVIKGGIFNSSSQVTGIAIDSQPKITLLSDGAFGPLSSIEGLGASNPTTDQAIGSESLPKRGFGGGGGLPTTSMIAPDGPYTITEFNHVYAGDEIDLGEESLEVLRRTIAPSYVGGLAGQFGLGLADLGKLTDLQYQNINLTQNKSDGIQVNINLSSGELSLNRYGEFYAVDEIYRPIQAHEIPDDDELIQTANKFIATYGISLDGYNNPIVPTEVRERIAYALSQPDIYLPEVVSVVYPLELAGTPVYDQGGNIQGVYVNINVRTKQVVSLYGLHTQQYEASHYPIVNDINTLIERYNGSYQYPEDVIVETKEVQLGTPSLVYSTIFQFVDGKEQHLLVPAYLFPVTEKPEGFDQYQSHILIPLINQEQGRPLPL